MDRNAQAAILIESALVEATSDKSWESVDKSKLPAKCFLWVEDPAKKETWHLPYREGAGEIDPKTGMYSQAGPVNLGALRAIAAAVGGARTGKPMQLPSEIKSKMMRLMKQYKIGDVKEMNMLGEDMDNMINSMKHQMIDMLDRMDKMGASMKEDMKAKMAKMKTMMADMLKMMTTPVKEGVITEGARDIILRESGLLCELTEAMHDKENGIVRGMAILRRSSVNHEFYREATGRDYSDKALQEAAMMVNNKKSYFDHQGKSQAEELRGARSVRDLAGVFENGRVENGVPKADLRYLPTQANKDFFEALVKLNAPGVGLSIVANGELIFDKVNKREIVNTIKEMRSVDLVAETGSTINLFESASGDAELDTAEKEVVEMEFTNLTLADLVGNRPDLVQQISESAKAKADKDGELAKLVQENAALKTENSDLKKKVDDYEVKEAIVVKKAEIEKEITESKIPATHITEIFRESLMDAKTPEARKQLLSDRKALVESATKGVKGAGDERTVTESGGSDKSMDDLKKEAATLIRG